MVVGCALVVLLNVVWVARRVHHLRDEGLGVTSGLWVALAFKVMTDALSIAAIIVAVHIVVELSHH